MRVLLLPLLALALLSAQIAHADSFVPNSIIPVFLAEMETPFSPGSFEVSTTVNLTPGGTLPFTLGATSGTVSESYALLSNGLDSFTFTVSSTDDLFPEYTDGATYAGGIGLGVYTPLQFTTPFDVTAAYISIASPEGYISPPYDFLPYYPDPFSGYYPSYGLYLNYDPIGGQDTTSLVLQIEGYGISSTPEPSSLMLLGTGMLGIAGAVRRKLRKA